MRTKSSQYPLRKIIGFECKFGRWDDVLECGHIASEADSIYGKRHPARRRCRECWKDSKGASVVLAVDPSVAVQ